MGRRALRLRAMTCEALLAIAATVSMVVAASCAPSGDATTRRTPNDVLKAAIMCDYQQGILKVGEVSGHLTDDQHNELRVVIMNEYPKWFAGTLLTNKLSFMLGWADRIATGPAVRTVTAQLKAFDVQSLVIHGAHADAIGSYSIYHVTATPIDEEGHEMIDGGWVVLNFQAGLTEVGSEWRVSDYHDQESTFTEDPSARAGQQYLPTSIATGT